MTTETTQTCQQHLDNEWMRSVMLNMGYRLEDRGDHWRTSAVFRGGGNSSAIMVFKNTGVWVDFANPEGYLPFGVLIERTTDPATAKKVLSGVSVTEKRFEESTLLKMEKTYPESVLNRLIPHFNFYIKRDISADLLKKVRAGYASGGDLYQRIVFPVYNKEGKIHGFTGRYIFWQDGDNKPKWKHIGNKKNWVYPLYSLPESADKIEETKRVYIVESVGDSLAMVERGHPNTMVLFSLALGPNIITELIARGVKEIVIATNNDADGQGQVGAARILIQLLKYFDYHSISILNPIDNDIHLMHMRDRNFEEWIESRITGLDALKWAMQYKTELGKKLAPVEKLIKFHE